MLKIGDATNEKGIPFFASNDLTVSGAELLWTGDRVLTATESLVRMVNGGASMGGATPDENGNLILYASNIYGSVLTVNGIAPDLSGNIIISSGVATVNGIEPDDDGNVEVGTVKSVNGNEPDKAGAVTVDIGVQSINGILPNDAGEVELEIPQGTVTSVNGEKPDESGAVEIQASDIAGVVTSVNGVAPVDGNVSVSLTTAGLVKYVDGIGPDDDGNVALEAVRTINGEKPDENGNITIGTGSGDGTVTSVNEIEPDNTGNISLQASDIPGTITSISGATPDENGNVLAILSINGNQPDEDGNIVLDFGTGSGDGTVTSVNGIEPVDGNITLEISDIPGGISSVAGIEPVEGNIPNDDLRKALGAVLSVNNTLPDEEGNVELGVLDGTGTVTSVNGIEPDDNGNVELPARLTIQRPAIEGALYPVAEASSNSDFSNTLIIDTFSVAEDRDLILVFDGTKWGAFPEDGMESTYAGHEASIDLSRFEKLGIPYYLRFCWLDATGETIEDWRSMEFPSASFAIQGNTSDGTVTSVDGVLPDKDGNVELPKPRLVIQRPIYDYALYPYIEASNNPEYDNSLEIDLYDDYDGNVDYCKVFNGDSWINIPKSGLGTPFDSKEVEIDLSKFESLTKPYYLRYGWVTSDGAYTNYKGMMYPSSSGITSPTSTSGLVKSINGETPDSDGNIELPRPRLVIQRPIYDYALYPYIEASNNPEYDDSLEIDLYDDYDGNVEYCKVFNGDSWINIPKSGLGTPFDSKEVEIDLSKFESLTKPYYLRYGWVTSDGAYTNYKGLMYPSSSGITSQSSSNDTTLPEGTQQGDILTWDSQWTVQSPAETSRLILQRPVSDLALFPYLEASNQVNFPDESIIISPLDNEDDFQYCQAFNSDIWMDIPKSGLGTPFDNMEVAINLAKLKTLKMPCYIRYGWVTSDGVMTNFHSMIFPSSSGSAPASQTVSKSDFENLQNKFNKLLELLEEAGIDVSGVK